MNILGRYVEKLTSGPYWSKLEPLGAKKSAKGRSRAREIQSS
jgi:hypothetical protein